MSGDGFSEVFFSLEADSGPPEKKAEGQGYRDRLDEIMESPGEGFSEKIQAILRLGAEWLGVENGHLTEIDPAAGTHTIALAGREAPALGPGDTTDLSNTYCRMVIARNNALGITDAPEQGFAEDPAYQAQGLSTYFGAKVVVSGELYGTACFVDREPRPEGSGTPDAVALRLLVRSIEQVLGRTRGDQPQALQQSREREETLRQQKSLLEQTQKLAGAWEVDLETEEIAWSSEMYRIYELPPNTEVTLEKAFSFYPPEGREKLQSAFERCAQSGEPYDLEVPLVTAEGTRRWVQAVGAPAKEEDGEVTKVTGALQDITEQKEVEHELRRQKSLLEQTQRLAGAWEVDLRTEKMSWSEKVYQIHEVDPSTEVGVEEGIEFYAPEARPIIRDAFRQCVEEGEPYDLELPI
ncbi:MAG: hypothetical protein BRD30_07665, partial [Bacteroidetes bacterium QH_2_63_10]